MLPEWTHASIEAKLKETAAALGVKAGELVHPARVAVTGKSVGPGLYETLEILGRERVLERFKRASRAGHAEISSRPVQPDLRSSAQRNRTISSHDERDHL